MPLKASDGLNYAFIRAGESECVPPYLPLAPSIFLRLEETDFRACECSLGRDRIDQRLSEGQRGSWEVNISQRLKGFLSELGNLLVWCLVVVVDWWFSGYLWLFYFLNFMFFFKLCSPLVVMRIIWKKDFLCWCFFCGFYRGLLNLARWQQIQNVGYFFKFIIQFVDRLCVYRKTSRLVYISNYICFILTFQTFSIQTERANKLFTDIFWPLKMHKVPNDEAEYLTTTRAGRSFWRATLIRGGTRMEARLWRNRDSLL